jgi:hypothetical protein
MTADATGQESPAGVAHGVPQDRSAETAEVERAVQAQKTCEAMHGVAHDSYEREGS